MIQAIRCQSMSGVLAVLGGLLLAACTAAADEPLEQVFEVKPDVRVEIEVVSGRIEVRGIDANEVRVRAEGGVQVDGSRRRVTLRAPRGGWPFGGGMNADVEVEVPRGSRISARTVNGPIQVESVDGELTLHAANGGIEVRGAPSESYLETVTSSIRFQGERSAVTARTINGSIELSGVSGDVEATAVSGSIRVAGDAIERAELRTMSGGIDLDASLAERARVSARTYSGSVRLRLPSDLSARIDVQSFSGGVRSAFEATDGGGPGGSWGGSPARHGFTVGDGDARISVESFSGSVEIEDSGS